jgi:hypothetical protein
MESRLDHSPLPEMLRAFAREEAVAEEIFCSLQGAAFHELVGAQDKYVADEVGMINEIHRLPAHPEPRNVAELGLTCEKAGTVSKKGTHMPADQA